MHPECSDLCIRIRCAPAVFENKQSTRAVAAPMTSGCRPSSCRCSHLFVWNLITLSTLLALTHAVSLLPPGCPSFSRLSPPPAFTSVPTQCPTLHRPPPHTTHSPTCPPLHPHPTHTQPPTNPPHSSPPTPPHHPPLTSVAPSTATSWSIDRSVSSWRRGKRRVLWHVMWRSKRLRCVRRVGRSALCGRAPSRTTPCTAACPHSQHTDTHSASGTRTLSRTAQNSDSRWLTCCIDCICCALQQYEGSPEATATISAAPALCSNTRHCYIQPTGAVFNACYVYKRTQKEFD